VKSFSRSFPKNLSAKLCAIIFSLCLFGFSFKVNAQCASTSGTYTASGTATWVVGIGGAGGSTTGISPAVPSGYSTLDKNLVVSAGATLTISNCNATLFIDEGVTITVGVGAHLIIEGVTLTSNCAPYPWNGIVANGNTSITSQWTSPGVVNASQTSVTLQLACTGVSPADPEISNAILGIDLVHGAILNCNDATFIDNLISIKIEGYNDSKVMPANTTYPNGADLIEDCFFEFTTPFTPVSGPQYSDYTNSYFIQVDDYYGLAIETSEFNSLDPNFYNAPMARGTAIYCYGGSVALTTDGVCTNSGVCSYCTKPNGGCSMEGVSRGVYAIPSTANPGMNIHVWYTSFDGVYYPISVDENSNSATNNDVSVMQCNFNFEADQSSGTYPNLYYIPTTGTITNNCLLIYLQNAQYQVQYSFLTIDGATACKAMELNNCSSFAVFTHLQFLYNPPTLPANFTSSDNVIATEFEGSSNSPVEPTCNYYYNWQYDWVLDAPTLFPAAMLTGPVSPMNTFSSGVLGTTDNILDNAMPFTYYYTTIVPSSGGSFTVTKTATASENNCTPCANGIQQVYDKQIKVRVYPNPAGDLLHLTYSLPATARNAVLFITDINGKKIENDELGGQRLGTSTSISTAGYANGIYLYYIVMSGGIAASGKFIISH